MQQCDHINATVVETTEATGQGYFYEIYECPNCGAKGRIEGEESESPQHWRKTGEVFA